MRRVLITILGTVLVVVGVVLCFVPGPGLLLIVAGLAVFATEFLWARRLRNKAVARADTAFGESPRAERVLDAIPGVDLDEIRREQDHR
jgi:uncharacterized protein (TIGR02611 family)